MTDKKTKNLNIKNIPPETHKQMLVYAINHDVTLPILLVALIEILNDTEVSKKVEKILLKK